MLAPAQVWGRLTAAGTVVAVSYSAQRQWRRALSLNSQRRGILSHESDAPRRGQSEFAYILAADWSSED